MSGTDSMSAVEKSVLHISKIPLHLHFREDFRMLTFCSGWRPRFTWLTWTSSSVLRSHQSQTQFYSLLSKNRWCTLTLRHVRRDQSARRSFQRPLHHSPSWTLMATPHTREEVPRMVVTLLRSREERRSSRLTTPGLCPTAHFCQGHFNATSTWSIAAPSSPSNMSANMCWR